MKTYWKKGEGIRVKGINWRDTVNLDDTFLQIIHKSLKYFRKRCVGYPGYLDNIKQWKKILKGVEDKFKKVIDITCDVNEENADVYLHEAFVALEDIFFNLWI